MKVLFAILLACMSVTAQENSLPRQKYGAPVNETYLVRSGVYATFIYDKSGDTCGLLITPGTRTGTLLGKYSDETIAESVLTEVIDELVPLHQRGKFLKRAVSNANCLDGTGSCCECAGNGDFISYEKVVIFLARSDQKDRKRYVEVRWSKATCDH